VLTPSRFLPIGEARSHGDHVRDEMLHAVSVEEEAAVPVIRDPLVAGCVLEGHT
jgi:hypothetical protein